MRRITRYNKCMLIKALKIPSETVWYPFLPSKGPINLFSKLAYVLAFFSWFEVSKKEVFCWEKVVHSKDVWVKVFAYYRANCSLRWAGSSFVIIRGK